MGSKLMKKWFNWFIYISLAFLVFALARADYFVAPRVEKTLPLLASFLLLFAGFLFDGLAWKQSLRAWGMHDVRFSHCLQSIGLSIFGKYIPGKIWVVLGKAGFIARKYNRGEKDLLAISVNAQFISLWCALLVGIVGLLFVDAQLIVQLSSVGLLLFFSLVLFTPWFHKLFMELFTLIFKKKLSIPQLSFRSVAGIVPAYLGCWLSWSAGFWLLAHALSGADVAVFGGLSFALAASLGMIAIVLPGGIGLREAMLLVFLIPAGLSENMAATVSLSSRLWYLAGELFIFVLALALGFYEKRSNRGC